MPQLSTKQMQAAVYDPNAKGLLSLVNIDKPSGDIVVQVTGCGVCGSDLLKLDRALVTEGTVLGHEMVAVINEISPELSKRYNLKSGDRIVSSHHVPCGTCKYCLNKQESLCKQFKTSNFNPGAFCEYTELSEGHLAHTVLKIPDAMTDEVASFTEPVACCIKAIKRSRLAEHKGQARVLVIGLGSIGLILGQLAKLSGAEVTGMDMLAARLELAQELGFDHIARHFERSEESPDFTQRMEIASPFGLAMTAATTTKQSTTQKYDYIFLAAGAASSIDTAVAAADDGATIVVFSSVRPSLRGASHATLAAGSGDEAISAVFHNNDIYYRELTITSSYSPNLEDLRESLELLEQGQIRIDKLITHRSNLENLGKTIEQAREEQGIKVYLSLS